MPRWTPLFWRRASQDGDLVTSMLCVCLCMYVCVYMCVCVHVKICEYVLCVSKTKHMHTYAWSTYILTRTCLFYVL